MKLKVTIILLALAMATGCANNPKPVTQPVSAQYNAAVISNDFAHALSQLQDTEASLYQSKIIAPGGHKIFKEAALKANQFGLQADQAISKGDWSSAAGILGQALVQLNLLTPGYLGITNPNSQLIYSSSLNAAIAVLEIKLSTAQGNAATPTK